MRTLLLPMVLLLSHAGAAVAATPDPAIVKQLKELDIHYTVDEAGDFQVVFEAGDKGERSQLVYVRTPVETYGSHAVREIWAPGYRAEGGTFPQAVANRLLESSQDQKLGGWVKQGAHAVFVVKIAADASPRQLRDAMEAAVDAADAIEAELTPGKDEF